VAAVQERLIVDGLVAVAARFVGAEGALASADTVIVVLAVVVPPLFTAVSV